MAIQPFWSATVEQPIATAEAGLKASISFRQPIWATEYTVTATDVTANTTAAVELSGDPVVVDGLVTLTTAPLAGAHEYTFAVKASAQYVTATSLATAAITAAA